MKEKQVEKKPLIIIIILSLIILFGISATLILTAFCRTPASPSMDYAPHSIENNAVPLEGGETDLKLIQAENETAISLLYAESAMIDLSEKRISLMFGNPEKTNQDIVLQIVIQDIVIVETGRITPGNKVVSLFTDGNIDLPVGVYNGKFVVYFYDEQTREKTMVTTELPLSVLIRN